MINARKKERGGRGMKEGRRKKNTRWRKYVYNKTNNVQEM